MGMTRDIGLLVLRVAVGATCFSHGARQLFGWFGGRTEEAADSISATEVEPGERNVWFSGALATGGGTLLALGLATGPVAAALAGNMAVARATRAPSGLLQISEGYELPTIYALLGATLAFTGPGRFSVDNVTGGALNRPWMRALALVGALVSAAYLISTRTAVVEEPDDDED
jgi:putative oxidoreductase